MFLQPLQVGREAGEKGLGLAGALLHVRDDGQEHDRAGERRQPHHPPAQVFGLGGPQGQRNEKDHEGKGGGSVVEKRRGESDAGSQVTPVDGETGCADGQGESEGARRRFIFEGQDGWACDYSA